MHLDPNFLEFIELLDGHDVRFLIVGGYAVALHGHPRYTADLDVWVWIDPDNADAVLAALDDFGFGEVDLTREDFLRPDHIVQLGYRAPADRHPDVPRWSRLPAVLRPPHRRGHRRRRSTVHRTRGPSTQQASSRSPSGRRRPRSDVPAGFPVDEPTDE